MKAVTVDQMKAIEQASVKAGVSLDTLMENAGLAVAKAVADEMGGAYGKRVVALIGPGNNGSDGFVAARHLARWGASARAFLCTKRPDPDEKRQLAEAAGVEVFNAMGPEGIERLSTMASSADVVIDAVLGAAHARPVESPLADALFAALQTAKPVIALDVPTGIDSDTGEFDVNGLPADITLMLGYPKLGALVNAGEQACGEVRVLDIGIPDGLADDVKAELITPEIATSLLPERAADSNKGTFGRTLIIGGSPNYVGATLLSTSAALRSGAGLVFLATREPVHRLVAGRIEEAIYYSLPVDTDEEYDVRAACQAALNHAGGMSSLLIGPGLGQSPATVQFMEQMAFNLADDIPVVLDADALNILSRSHDWWERVAPPKILTPHPGEMARLTGRSVVDIQADRPGAALQAAEKMNAVVVLKGAATIIASPTGDYRISPWVNAGLAKGGTGDVLAGLMAGLLAQAPEDPFDAAALAVYVHGLAGEIAREELGEIGMKAGDVAARLPAAFMQIVL